jgi:hypothetical protein
LIACGLQFSSTQSKSSAPAAASQLRLHHHHVTCVIQQQHALAMALPFSRPSHMQAPIVYMLLQIFHAQATSRLRITSHDVLSSSTHPARQEFESICFAAAPEHDKKATIDTHYATPSLPTQPRTPITITSTPNHHPHQSQTI